MLGSGNMLAKAKFLKGFSLYGSRRAVNGVFFCLFNGFCNANESSELPYWVKFPQGGDTSVANSDDDDFVLPMRSYNLADRVDSLRVHDHEKDVGYVSNEIVVSDVEEISKILKGWFDSPTEAVQALEGCNVIVSNSLTDKILKRFSNDYVAAFGFFRWAHMKMGYNHSADSWNTMVDILGKSKKFDMMWTLIEEMVQFGGLVSLVTVSKTMRRLAGAGRWKEAIEMFHKIESFGVRKDTPAMNILLDTLCKERSVEHARDVFMELRSNVPPNALTFNILIHGWCKFRKLDEVRWTMEEMERYGFRPCVISYTSLIEAYCMEKDFRKVDSILDEMLAKGCPPNVVTYTIIMHSLGKAKETVEALQIFEKMKRNGCTPDTSSYNSLIYILGRAGRLQDANNIFKEMRKSGISPNVTTFNTMISAICKHSQEENALKLLQKMEDSSCKPNVETYHPLLKLFCKRKMMKVLRHVLNDMIKKDVSLDLGTYSLLVHGLCRSGRLEQSCFFFKEMVLKGMIPKIHTYNMLIKELERKNMGEAKERIQQLMLEAANMEQSDHQFRL